ncbi:MAG TPA: hypothetical protein VKV38_08035 [Trebonia sp.]|nr:hypothetical protein [Trebonia sp.]
MSQWDSGMPPSGQAGGGSGEYGDYRDYRDYREGGHYPDYPGYGGDGDYPGDGGYYPGGSFPPVTCERDPAPAPARDAGPGPGPGLPWMEEPWLPRRRRRARRRWLVPALAAAAAASVAAAMVLTGGGPSGPAVGAGPAAPARPGRPAPGGAAAPAGMRPPLTVAQARQVVAGYTAVNNEANARRSAALLATVETGSSYAIDAGIYRVQRAENAAPYPAFGPRRALYFIPRQPAAYPHWFAVQVSNASLASPGQVTGTEYLVFTQAAAGAPWKNAIEPYLVAGASAPQVALGGGFATAVSAQDASLAVPPARIAQLTAASLDGSAPGGTAGPVAVPANLADRLDQAFWRSKVPAATVTDQHAAAPGGQVFGLATADGGALLFYTGAAELTLVPPQGEAIRLSIPGFYSPARALSRAGVGYLEQFAAYVPPRGRAARPRVVADYSGITSGN